MTVFASHVSSTSTTTDNTSTTAVLRPLMAAAALGLVLLYGVAFSHSALAHNAAHDVRHVTVKPCH